MTKILLIEDDKDIVENLTEFLKNESFLVKSASGQTAALEIIAKEKFDLVLLDISLSDGNGFAVCSAIKSGYAIPVIFLTASGDEYSTVTGFELGADDYIPKPFRPRELVLRIKNILRLTGNTGTVTQLGDVLVDTVNTACCLFFLTIAVLCFQEHAFLNPFGTLSVNLSMITL